VNSSIRSARDPSLRVTGKARNIYGSTLEEFTLWAAARKPAHGGLVPVVLASP